jgi:hypothetical protein
VTRFLRAGSIPIYGSGSPRERGSKVSASDYPFQFTDLATEPYKPWEWLWTAEDDASLCRQEPGNLPVIPAGNFKNPGFTPTGTHIPALTRKGHDMLAAPCGYCGFNLARCKCGSFYGYGPDGSVIEREFGAGL